MTERTFITPEEAAELRRLWLELAEAYREGAAALVTHGKPLEGEALKPLLAAEAKQAAIVRRIKEIQGTTGKHWME